MEKSNTKPYNYLNGYDVRRTRKGKIWTRVATAWPHHSEREGFTVELHAIPLTGTIVFLPPDPKAEESEIKTEVTTEVNTEAMPAEA